MAKKKLQITLVRSPLSRKPNHRRTVKALGLKKVGETVIHDDNDVIRGMANSIDYLINVVETR
ncbi:MAG: 50S ribosomal protein L30 [Bacillota bacterium]